MTMKDTAKKRKIPYRVVLLMSLFFLVVVFVFLFTVITISDYRRESREIAKREAEYTAERIVSQVDERFDNLWQYYLKTISGSAMNYALENDLEYQDIDHYLEVQELLADSKIFGEYINGYTFINFNTRKVISNKGMFSFVDMKNKPFLNELMTMNNEKLDKNYWYYDNVTEPVAKTSRDYRLTAETRGIDIVMKLPNQTPRAYGLLIVNINESVWQGWINALVSDYEQVVVTDKNGKLIYATDKSLADAFQTGDKFHDAESLQDEDGRSYMIHGVTSNVMSWRYYVLRDINYGVKNISRLNLNNMLIMLAIVLFCLGLALYFMYLPVKNLVKSFREDGKDEASGSDLDFLENRYAQEKKNRKQLEAKVSRDRKKIQELFELRLIRGEVKNDDEWNDYFQGLAIKKCKYYATAVMVLNLKGELDTKDNISEDALCLKIVENLPEYLNSLTWMPLVYNACTMFCIFGEDDEGALLEKIMDFHSGMQKHVDGVYGNKIIMGVSATHTDYRHIYAAYRESVNALTMETVKDEDECRFYLLKMTERVEAFDPSFEENIKVAVKASDKEQCYVCIDNFHNYLKTLSSMDDIYYVILRMINAILEAAKSVGLEYKIVFPNGLRVIYRDMLAAVEPSFVRRYLKYALIDPILLARSEKLEDNTKVVMERLEKLIDDTEGAISLTECAAKLDVHPTYIWKVLKMERGMAFGEFIEFVKLKKAKELLLRTSLSVNDISDRLGYANPQAFTRLFTKETGLSPAKFRKLY
ncbi:MAG: helix-turn-helix domain-containing protein [Lachnospiraceae bacterium]|nr:helix-turn-helix domain-containing protein [Lachnospiraceae bacterium]